MPKGSNQKLKLYYLSRTPTAKHNYENKQKNGGKGCLRQGKAYLMLCVRLPLALKVGGSGNKTVKQICVHMTQTCYTIQ